MTADTKMENRPATSGQIAQATEIVLWAASYAQPSAGSDLQRENRERRAEELVKSLLSEKTPQEHRTPTLFVYALGMISSQLGMVVPLPVLEEMRVRLDGLLCGGGYPMRPPK